MWIWWALSLLILIASTAFALYIYYGNYKTNEPKKDFFLQRRSSFSSKFFAVSKQQVITSLRLKLQSVENNSALYFNELKKLQQRIQAIEKGETVNNKKTSSFDEDWEELYYEVNDKKEKLENELDATTQALESVTYQLNKAEANEKLLIEKQSELETQLNQAQSLQNKIGDLQRELEGAAERETDLQVELDAHKELAKDFELLQQQYAQLQSEANEIQNRMIESKNREVLSKQKINRLTKLESTIEISEYEKMEIKKSIEEIIIENEALATKLQELQEKLSSEKYA